MPELVPGMAWCSLGVGEEEGIGFYPSRVPLPEEPSIRDPWAPVEPPAPGCRWFDVTLYIRFGPDFFPAYAEYIQASGAFLAVEEVMRRYRVGAIPYASAYALDRSVIYRAYGIKRGV